MTVNRFQPTTPFVPMPGARGPHAQTILASFLRIPRPPQLRRERWETPDGDFVDVDVFDAPDDRPHVLVLHGLEGSSRAGYVLETLNALVRRGYGAVALNFRSCSGEPNRFMRAYNSGDISDALFAATRLRERGVKGPLLGVGFSLGGSVLLNLLARTGESCPLSGAAAVSVPFDLDLCATLLDQAKDLTQIYRRVFVRSLKSKTIAKCQTLEHALDPARIRRARGIRQFDDAVTAPLFDYPDAGAYYRDCSSGPKLGDIRRPTLLLSAEDDPLAPASMLPEDASSNPHLTIVRTPRGGHVGFMGGSPLHPRFWAEEQAVAFLEFVLQRGLAR